MKKKLFLSSKGYTLVEMLAVIIIFSVIGGIIAAIFASSLRGSNKANITNEVRQNGNYALAQMSKTIAYAKNFEGVSFNGQDYTVDCYIEPVAANTPTPTPTRYSFLRISNFDGGQTIFRCDANAQEIASNAANLVNTDTVKIDSCGFFCTQSSIADSPTIGIKFILSQKKESNFFEQKANISFETTMVIRN